ncbi:MAG: NAD-dependent epimerase/dehydratase family protein [Actinomycetota bacterium]
MKAVVTGGAGFIGSHLAERLQAEGREVKVVDNLSSGEQRLEFLESAGIAVDPVDIRDPACTELIESFAPDEIYHLAAQMDVRRSVQDPIYDADVNVLGTVRVLQAAVKVGARVMAASSGGCIYGEAPAHMLPLDESAPRNPDSPYGITKSVMEDYLRFFRATQGLDYVALALGNVYGPRQDPFGEAGVVAIFVQRLLDGRPCVIYGDGEQTRDFCYVADVVDAFVAAGGYGAGELFNIGTSIETGVNELYRALAGICGVQSAPDYEPPRRGELQRSCLDSGKAKRLLGWTPSTDMDRGLRETVEFIRSRG